jgi:DNA-binding XRE family transcriptional regulator
MMSAGLVSGMVVLMSVVVMATTLRPSGSHGDYPSGHAGGDLITSQVMVRTRKRSYSDAMARPAVGELLRDWRTRRRRSQMDVALDVGVSTRHLSFVETGRARPSAELVLAIAHHLDVPAMGHVRASIQRMNVAMVNRAGSMLADGLPSSILGPPLNVYRLCLHPEGLARRTTNFTDWATYLLEQLRRTIMLTGDPALTTLLEEVLGYVDDVRHSLDVTIDELAIELFFPADDRSDQMLHAMALTRDG